MDGIWRLTAIGGAENGMSFELSADREMLVGRTHSADVRLTEGDVSGRHLRIFTRDGVPMVVSDTKTSTTQLNGRELGNGEEAVVAAGDVLSLGKRIRLRIDEAPASVASASPEDSVTGATRWTESEFSVPVATLQEETVATRFADMDETVALGATASFASSPVLGQDETIATSFHSTGHREMSLPAETTVSDTGHGGFATLDSAMANDDGETEVLGGSYDFNDEGKTVAAETQVAPAELIEELRRKDMRKQKGRRAFVALAMAVFAGFMVALWFLTRSDVEADSMAFPKKPDGSPDVARYFLKDDSGRNLLYVDYPRNPKMSITESPDGAGVSVVSFMGRDRDVPFFLQIDAQKRPEELEIDLMTSLKRWFSRMEASGQGLIFDERMKDEVRQQFFEDVYPTCCELPNCLYGVKFVRFDYKRARSDAGKDVWHGVALYFRLGDTVYVHRREIPEFYWARGGYRIMKDPNIAIFSNFTESYWESPGISDLPVNKSSAELMAIVRASLAKERASDWRFVKKSIDALLVKSWRNDPKTRDLALGCLRQFRDVLKVYYYQKYNAYANAKSNRFDKKAVKVRQDAEMVFDDKFERYYYLMGDW